MKHPLINPSLTPHGFGIGNTYTRSSWKSDNEGRFNGDWGAARYWQEANRLDNKYRPAEHIVHEIMPSMRTIGRTKKGDFEFAGKPYQVHDLAVVTRIAVWLGCNNGRAMLCNNFWNAPKFTKTNEFRVRWRESEKPQSEGYMLRHLLHECRSDTCGLVRGFQICHTQHRSATEREKLVLDAFLFWLGTDRGREYITGLELFLAQTGKAVWNGYTQRLQKEREERQRRRQTKNA